MANGSQKIEISTATILRVLLFVLGVVFLYRILDIIAVVLFALIIASAVEPLAIWLTRFKIPRLLAVLLIYLGVAVFLGLVVYLVVPTLVGELRELSQAMPQFYDRTLEDFGVDVSKYGLAANLEKVFERFSGRLGEMALGAFGLTSSVFSGFLAVISVIVISFYLSVREGEIENFLRLVSPPQHREYVVNLWERVKAKFGRWLQGQILLGVLVGVMVFLMLTILSVEHAALLAILAAVFELIPVFGPIMAAIPAIAIAALQQPMLGLLVAGLFILVQQIENHLIYPLVVRKTVGVPPLLVVLSLIIGAKLGGFFGIVLSVPIAAVLVEFLNDVSARKYPKT